MRLLGLAGTVVAVAVVLSMAGAAEGEIRTDGLSRRNLKAWKAIVDVVEAVGADGQPRHPVLRRLYRELDASTHTIRILIPDSAGTSAIGGRFRIDSLGSDGRHETSIVLNLRVIDRALTGSPQAQLVTFDTLGRAERRAQVLGHEMAHAEWALRDPQNARLAAEVQQRSLALAERARTEGTAGEGLAEALERNEQLVRSLEEPALEAEAEITRELRAKR
jgi:hypothetical protein